MFKHTNIVLQWVKAKSISKSFLSWKSYWLLKQFSLSLLSQLLSPFFLFFKNPHNLSILLNLTSSFLYRTGLGQKVSKTPPFFFSCILCIKIFHFNIKVLCSVISNCPAFNAWLQSSFVSQSERIYQLHPSYCYSQGCNQMFGLAWTRFELVKVRLGIEKWQPENIRVRLA